MASPAAGSGPTPLTAMQIAWAAGFIEGEGTLAWNGREGQRKPHHGTPAISVTQVQREPLDRLIRIFGGSEPRLYKNPGTCNSRQPAWQWRLYGPAAAGAMMTLYAFMSPRRKERIRAALKMWREAPGRRRFTEQDSCKAGHDLTAPGARKGEGQKRRCAQCVRDRWIAERDDLRRRRERASTR